MSLGIRPPPRLVGRQEMDGERLSFSPLTVRQALQSAALKLKKAGIETPRLDAEVLLAHCLNVERPKLYLCPGRPLKEEEEALWRSVLQRRLMRQPVAYITGWREFFGLRFRVDRRVFIPRPESEHLVEEALRQARQRGLRTIADIGTGCGCVGISLAKHLRGLLVYIADISSEALEVAAVNARQHGVDGCVVALCGDLLEPLPEAVDMIVGNLPYIPSEDCHALPPEVQLWEPRLALDGGQDGLGAIRLLLSGVDVHLRPGGVVLLEIGAEQGPAASALAAQILPGSRVRILPDYAGHDRVLVVESEGGFGAGNGRG